MDINSAFATKYLKASDLQGRDVTVRMGRVEQEKVGDDHKLILYFQGKEKGMVLNKTNANAIADVYGPETGDWYGQPIILFEQMVDFQGKRVPGLRIRAPRQQAAPRPVVQRSQADYRDYHDDPSTRDDPISSGPQEPPRRANGADSLNDDIPF